LTWKCDVTSIIRDVIAHKFCVKLTGKLKNPGKRNSSTETSAYPETVLKALQNGSLCIRMR